MYAGHVLILLCAFLFCVLLLRRNNGKGSAVSFQNTMDDGHRMKRRRNHLHFVFFLQFSCLRLCAGGHFRNNNKKEEMGMEVNVDKIEKPASLYPIYPDLRNSILALFG